MNKQRKVLITITYNEMGIIIDTKAEEVAQPEYEELTPEEAAIDAIKRSRFLVDAMEKVIKLPSAQPETAKRIVGKSRDGMTLWYQCDMCNEPVDAQDDFCRGCGRRLTDG